jgi:hypothetical protein
MQIVVIGGTGFLGGKTVAALRRFPGLTVEIASRRGPIVVDLSRPETFEALRGADVLIDLADGTRSQPDALARWCLSNGLTLIEATSDADTIRRLREGLASVDGPGCVVLGGGIFTGVSNLIARRVADDVGEGSTLTWAVASSPYSGAGKGTIALMVEASARPAVSTVKGHRIESTLSRGPRLNIAGTTRPTLRMSLAESEMLPASTKATTVETYFAPKPGFLVTAFTLMPTALLRQRWFLAMLELSFSVLRRFVLRSVPSAVEMVAKAERGPATSERHVTCSDGMDAGAWALAAMAEAVGRRRPRAGLCFIDDATTLELVCSRVNEVAGRVVLVVSGPQVLPA